MLDAEEFYGEEAAPLSDERCDVCNGRLPVRTTKRGTPRQRHDRCIKAMKRMRAARIREAA